MRIHAATLGVVFLCALAAPAGTASALILTLESPPVLGLSDETGSFTLSFPGFLQGTVSGTQSVTYRIEANNMTAGTIQGAVSARLQETASGIDLEADVAGYQNLGNSNFAMLQESQSGYRVISTDQTSLADKTPGNGAGNDKMLDGNLTLTWRARLTADAPAGQQSRLLVVTIREGN